MSVPIRKCSHWTTVYRVTYEDGEERRRSELDGAVEYDPEHHWLTYTEWLGEEDVEWGATEIVATEVRPWFGLRVEALFEIMAQESPAEPRMPRPRPRRLPGWLARLVGRLGLMFVLVAAAPRGASEPPSTAPALLGAPHERVPVPFTRAVVGSSLDLGTRHDGGAPLTAVGTASLGGYATFYDVASGNAAAGPDLRAALGGDPAFRGETVRVCSGNRCLRTTLTDWCACGDRNGRPTLIDLARSDFARLGSTRRGVLLVTIELDAKPVGTLPPTDMEGP